ncbi:glycosyltransferase family 4 protein [Xenorhabdus sp. Reich]|uniref:Glycosyltransferase family 4 protein n=1 Tax=Xenorhabdus littoralis TaxID=2582835 RepID=A0ABU4SJL7_9GAMM|nr:glycosyltransferase family 4 protein [Xenorhabdus sp. Reich]MDX7998849.1 glycosyltransferase family 4 protein [Xenorhabdus sp. Reich]
MKILLIGNQSNTIILFRKNFIKLMIQKKIIVHTLTMDFNKGNFERIKSLGAHPEQYKFSRSGINPISDIINTIRLSKKIKEINPDIVLCFFPKPIIFGSIASKIAQVTKIYSLFEGLGYTFTETNNRINIKKTIIKKLQILLYKISLPLSNKVLFLNKDDQNEIISNHKVFVKTSSVIGGIGVDINEFTYTPISSTRKIHFSMVSRLLVEKGVREFIEAAKIVKQDYPFVEFSIAGSVDDNPGGITSTELELWQRENIVTFKGQISNIKDFLIDSSVFVLPSYREGVPRSTQEAMAIGRAILTTDVPGCRDTVIDGYNGFLVPPYNSKALANKMIQFLNNPDLLNSMGLASRKLAVERFDENVFCERLLEILTSS